MKNNKIDLLKFFNKKLNRKGWEVEDYKANMDYLESERRKLARKKYNSYDLFYKHKIKIPR